MPHMVVFRKEGKPGYHWAETLDDAVRFVEHLRNNEQVPDSKVYRMQEVPLEFKVLYKVEVAGGASSPGEDSTGSASADSLPGSDGPASAQSTPPPQARVSPREADESAPVGQAGQPAPAASAPAAQGGGRFGLFSKA